MDEKEQNAALIAQYTEQYGGFIAFQMSLAEIDMELNGLLTLMELANTHNTLPARWPSAKVVLERNQIRLQTLLEHCNDMLQKAQG